jgi:hypothetical protein
MSAKCREPLCPFEVLPLRGWPRRPPGRALPLRRCSYGLMRQTKPLPPASVVPRWADLCRLLPAPAGRWSFPALSPQSLCGRLDPYPATLRRCSDPLPSRRTSASPQLQQVRRAKFPTTRLRRGASISGLQSFLDVQAPTLARPPDRAHRGGSVSHRAAGPFTPRNGRAVACSNCGIATHLNRVIDMAGLTPAGLWPCRPLPEAIEAAPSLPRHFVASEREFRVSAGLDLVPLCLDLEGIEQVVVP